MRFFRYIRFGGPFAQKCDIYKMPVRLYAGLEIKLLDRFPANSQQTYQLCHQTCTQNQADKGQEA